MFSNLQRLKMSALLCLTTAIMLICRTGNLEAATLSIAGNSTMRNEIISLLASDTSLDPKFLESELKEFESRAEIEGLREEVPRCYLSILKNSGKQPDTDSATLTSHLLAELADPGQVNQGKRNTCALATLEVFLYRREPSLVCDTVYAARSGELRAADGTPIKLPPECLAPDRESRYFRPDGPYRSFASQIFQIAAANSYWQTQNKDPRGITVPRGSISYIQFDGPGYSARDSKERLTIQWSKDVTEFVTGSDNLPESSPALTLARISDVYKSIAGSSPKPGPSVLCHRKRDHDRGVTVFSNENELYSILSKLKQTHGFPAIISIRPQASGLRAVNGTAIERHNQGRWHVVCIAEFNPESNGVLIEDFSILERRQELQVQDLYDRTCPPRIARVQAAKPLPANIMRAPALLF